MKRQTRTLLLNIATGVALAMTAAVVLAPISSMGASAIAQSTTSIRAVPTSAAEPLGTLRVGDRVTVDCLGDWCPQRLQSWPGSFQHD